MYSVGTICFTTDAAGIKKNATMKHCIGAGAIESCYPLEHCKWAVRALWPLEFINNSFDEKNSFIGAKSTTLEMTGVAFFHRVKTIRAYT